jgi:dsRNA-specific ribonuclease
VAKLIHHAKSNAFLATIGLYYKLDKWVRQFDYSMDDSAGRRYGKSWADVVEAYIGCCERERVLWWENDSGSELQRWLEWVYCVR